MKDKVPDEVRHSAYGARGFYIITYALFYLSVYMYPNPLKEGSNFWKITYFLMHIVTIWLFLTTADNPGYAEPDGEKQPNLLKMEDDNSIETTNSDELAPTLPLGKDIELGPIKNPSFGYVRELQIPVNRGCKKCGIASIPFRAKHCNSCNRCVRKFDHHCFWIGGCVGELNHGKFWLFTFLQAVVFIQDIHISLGAYASRFDDFPHDKKMRTHVQGIWMLWLVISFLFLIMTGGLAVYHAFLIATAQSTWEHTRHMQITYLRPYPKGLLPFYISIWENIKSVFCNGGKYKNWEMRQPHELKEIQGFNICENEYYSCC